MRDNSWILHYYIQLLGILLNIPTVTVKTRTFPVTALRATDEDNPIPDFNDHKIRGFFSTNVLGIGENAVKP